MWARQTTALCAIWIGSLATPYAFPSAPQVTIQMRLMSARCAQVSAYSVLLHLSALSAQTKVQLISWTVSTMWTTNACLLVPQDISLTAATLGISSAEVAPQCAIIATMKTPAQFATLDGTWTTFSTIPNHYVSKNASQAGTPPTRHWPASNV